MHERRLLFKDVFYDIQFLIDKYITGRTITFLLTSIITLNAASNTQAINESFLA